MSTQQATSIPALILLVNSSVELFTEWKHVSQEYLKYILVAMLRQDSVCVRQSGLGL
jgi:hypothetical protein